MNKLTFALFAALALSCVKQVPESSDKEPAVKIYVASAIRTNDPARPVVQAIAVENGKIIAVGTEDEVRAARADAQVIRVPGVIVPGLQDSHAHLLSLGRSLSVVDLRGSRSVDEVLARLSKATPDSHEGDWLVGRGWDQNLWPEQAFPHRRALDDAFGDATPIWLTRIDGHAAWVNGAALKRAGVTRETKDPEGGRFLRDAQGELTGVLIDNAMDVVSRAMPKLTSEQRQRRLQLALRAAASRGLTCVHDAGMDLETFDLLQQWDTIGALPIRVYAMADGQDEHDAEAYLGRGPFEGRFLAMHGVKFLLDGALGSRGAAMHQPYSDSQKESGLLLMSPETLEQKMEAFMARGFQVNTHAIGDRANTLVLDAIEAATKKTGGGPGRARLEHAQVMRPEDIQRLASLHVIASMQPTHATSDMGWAEARVGASRIKGAYAWRSVLDAGGRLAFGSDFPIEEVSPLLGFYAARTRQDANGKPEGGWYPEQKLTGEETLRAFTVDAAYASFSEDRRGSLKPGMDADFVAFSVDPVSAPPAELLKAQVIVTVVGGKPAYEANPLR